MLFSVCLLLPSLASAAPESENWYHVEIISFSQYKSPQDKENWSRPASTDMLQETDLNAAPLPASLVNPQTRALDKKDFKLTAEAYSISRKRGYTIHSHQAWAIPGMEKDVAGWLILDSDSQNLTGKVRIYLSTYLHANVDARLLNPDWSATSMQPADSMAVNARPVYTSHRYIPFKSNRRMKLDELHYIDHPMAGMLIKVERYKADS